MDIGNGELMQECFPKHSSVGTVRMKYDKQTKKVRSRVSMERSKAGTKKKKSCRPITELLLPN